MRATSETPSIAVPAPQTSSASDGWVTAALSVQTLISAGTFLVAKHVLRELPVPTVVLWRFVLSASVFAVALAVLPARALPPRRAIRMVVVLGFLVGPLNQGLFFLGLSHSSPAHASLLYALTPVGVYLYALARRREAFRIRAGFGIGLALVGVLVLLLGGGVHALTGLFVGDLLILAAVAAWVVYTAEGKAFIGEHGALRATCWSMIAGCLWLLPAAPFFLAPGRVWAATVASRLCILYLALLTSVVSYLLWYAALGRTDASKVAVFSNLQPVATAVAAWLLLGSPIGWEIGAGGLLVLAGVRLTQRA